MAKLFISGHNVEQTPEYEAWRMEYLQTMVDRAYPYLPSGTHNHMTTG